MVKRGNNINNIKSKSIVSKGTKNPIRNNISKTKIKCLVALTLAAIMATTGGGYAYRTTTQITNIPGTKITIPKIDIQELHAENVSGGDYEDLAINPIGGEGYSAVLYDNTNGLPTSEANAIAETNEGFIWIGSYSGLIRYDGNTFERIDSTTGIASVVSLYVDSKNRLWVGTNDSGVAVYEKGKFTMFKNVEGLKSSSIRAIVEDKDGNIFVATTSGLGMIDTDMKLHAIDESQLNGEYIQELRKDANGTVYGNTLSGAVFLIKDKKVTEFYDGTKMGMGPITTILPDSENPDKIYLGTEKDIIYYGHLGDTIDKFEAIDVNPLSSINSIEHFNDQLWITSDRGIGILKGRDFQMVRNIPLNNSIDRMMADYEGNMWFVSSRQGVMKIVPNQFDDISFRFGLENAVINSTCISDDILYIGTDTGLIAVNKSKKLTNLKIQQMTTSLEEYKDTTDLLELFKDVRIRSIIKDSNNKLWFSTYSPLGLVEYDKGKVRTYTSSEGMPSDRVRVVSEKSDGTIMVATSGGLVMIKDDEIKETFAEDNGLSNTEILTVCEGDNGKILLGSDGNGIYILDGNNVSNLGVDDGLSSEVVMRIKKDSKRNLYWIITSNSLAYLKDGKITTISKFPYSNNFDMYENKEGKMWILSSNGIYVISSDELLESKEISPVFYSRDNGIPYITTANSYSYLSNDGNLYISGNAGVAKVNIDEPGENINDIKIAIPFIEADGEMIYADDNGKIVIPANVKRITIYSYVYTYSLMNPKVTYRLKGFDKDSVTVNRKDLEPVAYTNLDGGTYEFVISLQTSLGEGYKEVSVIIEKEKAIFEQLWFKILMGILIVAAVAFAVMIYVRRKTKALLKKEKENKLFIREMIEAFAKTIDMKDNYTNGHSQRVAEYTRMLAEELGYDDETVDKYYNIALLHDIGKIAIPSSVLNKPGKLTDQEFNIIKSHSAQGYKVLKDISIMPELAIGAGAHHERPDGKGYPKGLKGDEIPRVAQIIAVADTFDAMYSDRPYRKRMNFEKAISIIKEVSGTQLETDVVDAFLRLVDKGEFRAPDDNGGGTTEDINNIHKRQDKEEKESEKKVEEVGDKADGKPTDDSDEK